MQRCTQKTLQPPLLPTGLVYNIITSPPTAVCEKECEHCAAMTPCTSSGSPSPEFRPPCQPDPGTMHSTGERLGEMVAVLPLYIGFLNKFSGVLPVFANSTRGRFARETKHPVDSSAGNLCGCHQPASASNIHNVIDDECNR